MTVEYYLGDHLGSTSITTDSSGAKVSELRYKPFGEVRYAWTSAPVTTPVYSLTRFTYTGQYTHMDDPTTAGVTEGFGLMFYNARWYDPALGRFAQADTIVPAGVQGLDHYAYANNNPILYSDPSGHFAESVWDAISLGFGIASLGYNLSQGNYTDAAIDVVGIVVDAAALAVPVVPGGAGAAIKAYRALDAAAEVAEVAVKYGDEIAEGASLLGKYGDMIGAVCSFSEDTLVTTREGKKPIADLKTGEEVLAWNEETGEVGYYEITDTFSHVDPILTELVINGEWVETTPEHPFYTLEEGWLPADEIESGMHIRQADGDYELVWLKWNLEKDQEMYNLTVDTAHTYFVGEGQWLVHNSCGDDIWEIASNLGEQSSRSPFVRELPGNVDDARNLFDNFSQNATEIIESDNGMLRSNFDDGTVVTFRSESSQYWSKGAPTVEVNHPLKDNTLKLKFLGN